MLLGADGEDARDVGARDRRSTTGREDSRAQPLPDLARAVPGGRAARRASAGLDVVGFFHSHPDHPAAAVGLRPRARLAVLFLPDRERASTASRARRRAWRLADDRTRFEPETLDDVRSGPPRDREAPDDVTTASTSRRRSGPTPASSPWSRSRARRWARRSRALVAPPRRAAPPPLRRAGPAAPLRQRLPQRRGRPSPAAARPRRSAPATRSRSCPASPAAPTPARPGARPAPPAWATGADGLPPLSPEELLRYSRHLILPEVGLDGQRRLKAASVLLVGAGGLGSPLGALPRGRRASARIGLVDFDVVDASNLQRQVLHGTVERRALQARVGAGAAARPQPATCTSTRTRRGSTSENALEHPAAPTTSSSTAPTTSRPATWSTTPACCSASPTSTAASSASRARRACSTRARGPCYRCLYPEPPPPGLVPSLRRGRRARRAAGRDRRDPGASRRIKLLLGIGEPLIGRLLLFDALAMSFRELKLRKDPSCPICGEHPTITRADRLRGVLRPHPGGAGRGRRRAERDRPRASWQSRLQRRGADSVLIDVREPHEWEIARIPGALADPARHAARAAGRARQQPRDRPALPPRPAQHAGARVPAPSRASAGSRT